MSPIVTMSPHIRLQCDECGEEPGEAEFGGWFCYPADDVEKALNDACYHRIGEEIVCDGCAYERLHSGGSAASEGVSG